MHAKTPSGIGMSKGWTAAGLSGASKCGEVQMTCALTIQIKIYIYIYCWLFTITIYIYIYHEVYSTSNLQIFCGTPCALHHLLCFAGSDDMCAQTMSKKTCMYTYIYICLVHQQEYTLVLIHLHKGHVLHAHGICVCVCVCHPSHKHIYIYIYTRILFGPEAISSVRK